MRVYGRYSKREHEVPTPAASISRLCQFRLLSSTTSSTASLFYVVFPTISSSPVIAFVGLDVDLEIQQLVSSIREHDGNGLGQIQFRDVYVVAPIVSIVHVSLCSSRFRAPLRHDSTHLSAVGVHLQIASVPLFRPKLRPVRRQQRRQHRSLSLVAAPGRFYAPLFAAFPAR